MESKTAPAKERAHASVWGTLVALAVNLITAQAAVWGAPQETNDLSHQIF